jgi:hypothetical protein
LIKTLHNGIDNITAVFVGDSNFATSTSNNVAITVSGITVLPATALNSTSGSVLSGTLATFNTNAAGPFTVTVDWGDGTAQGSNQLAPTDPNFLTVTNNGGGNYSISGSHTYNTTTTGVTIESPIFTVTSADGTTGSATGAISVTAPAATINAGLSMITLPYDYSASSFTAAQVLDLGTTNALATWTGSSYDVYPNLPGLNGLKTLPGVGYWVRETADAPIVDTGALVTGPYTIIAHGGWNQIGDPFLTDIPFADVTISGGTVGSALFGYDPLSNSYVAGSTLRAFEGYWLYITPNTGGGAITITYND